VSRDRLLNRDGTFNVAREGIGWLEALAPHELLRISWPKFIGLVAGVYLLLNLIFGALFVAFGPDDLLGPGVEMLGGRLGQAFFFSVQTFATIGYGQVGPNGLAANLIVTVEALVGMMYQALATGLLFVRFARPRADILFSPLAVIAPYHGGLSLQFRLANVRRNELIELEAQVLYARHGTRWTRRRSATVLAAGAPSGMGWRFSLAWTIVHPIDETSPLNGKTREDMTRTKAEILVLLSGIDETFEQTVHVRSSYHLEIAWNARFTSMYLPSEQEARVAVDLKRLHSIESVKT
jgi:inward rectifier potassium channel